MMVIATILENEKDSCKKRHWVTLKMLLPTKWERQSLTVFLA